MTHVLIFNGECWLIIREFTKLTPKFWSLNEPRLENTIKRKTTNKNGRSTRFHPWSFKVSPCTMISSSLLVLWSFAKVRLIPFSNAQQPSLHSKHSSFQHSSIYGWSCSQDFGKISHQNFQPETSASPFDSNHQKPPHLLSPQNPRVVGMRSCLKSNGKQHVSQGKSPRRGRVGPRGQVTALSLWKTAGGKLDLRWLVKHNFWRWAEMQTQQLMR